MRLCTAPARSFYALSDKAKSEPDGNRTRALHAPLRVYIYAFSLRMIVRGDESEIYLRIHHQFIQNSSLRTIMVLPTAS